MQISWQWLCSLVDLPAGSACAPADLAALLTSVGLEVDGITTHGAGLEAIIVGELRGKRPHPEADRLTLVELFDGTATRPVVCGAGNLPGVGGKVAFAPVGARLPGGLEIAPREVRGELSEGMICSEEELEIGSDGAGILVLPEDWAAGERLIDRVPGIVDTILEIGVTPNRPDALGHLGVARDLAVKLGGHLRPPPTDPAVSDAAPAIPSLVTLAAPAACGRYLGFVVDGVSVGPSPLWLRVRLHRLGLRALSNCVDITNYVLMECGQPLHAFDRQRLAEGRVVVRQATAGEAFAALDGSSHTLVPEDLVIADAAIPQALAGVMGGARSLVHGATHELLLEAAWFAPRGIRATSRRHSLSSDSSYRFERGVDFGAGLDFAAQRALYLLRELTGGRCRGRAAVTGTLPAPPTIALRLARVQGLLGISIGEAEAARILRGLGVEVTAAAPASAAPWACVAPSHRPDLTREVDLIEELMRFHGLEDLPAVASVPSQPTVEVADPRARLRERLTDALCGAGLHEHLAYAFTHPDKLRPFLAPGEEAGLVALANPLRLPLSVMRTALLPDLLDALEINLARHPHALRLFAQGRVYRWAERPGSEQSSPAVPTAQIAHDAQSARDAQISHDAQIAPGAARAAPIAVIDRLLPEEREQAAILLCGEDATDARAGVGVWLHALESLGYEARAQAIADDAAIPYLHPGIQGAIAIRQGQGWLEVGLVGELHPDLVAARGLGGRGPVIVGVLWVDLLPPLPVPVARERPRFPATSRDLSLDLPARLPAGAVVDALPAAAAAQPVVGDDPVGLVGDGILPPIEVVEEYRGEGVAAGRRALLLRLHYRARERSLTDAEVQTLHGAIVGDACDRLRARGVEVGVR